MGEQKETETKAAKGFNLNDLLSLKYGTEIAKILFEDWMDDKDKNEYILALELHAGITMTGLNNDIQKGQDNGYSFKMQMIILSKMLGR